MANPTLSDLIGGIQAVTLGDEEAKRRGTQKTILERKAPPTFTIVVEIQDRNRVAIHSDTAEAVDAKLRDQSLTTEVRFLDEAGEVQIQQETPYVAGEDISRKKPPVIYKELPGFFLFGINRRRLEQVARDMHLKLSVVDKLADANLLVTSRNYYRRKPQKIRDAETANLPIYVLKNHTPSQFRQFLNTIYPATSNHSQPNQLKTAIDDVEQAVDQVQAGQESVELNPQSAYIRRLQHLIAERSNLSSQSTGKEPDRRVRIYREKV
jgi:hypothetical protein